MDETGRSKSILFAESMLVGIEEIEEVSGPSQIGETLF